MSADLLQNILEVTPAPSSARQSDNSSAGSTSKWRQDTPDNDPSQSAPAEAVNTDYPQSNTQNDTSAEQPESFSDTLDKKIKDSEPQDVKVDENAKKPAEDTEKSDPAPETTTEGTVSSVQTESADQAELIQAAGAKVVNPVQQEAKNMVPGEVVSSTAKPVTPETPSPIAESAQQTGIGSKQGVSEIAKQMEKPLQTQAVQTENKPIQTEAAEPENKPDVPENSFIPAVRPENANVIGMPEAAEGKFVASGKDLTSENGKAALRDLTDASAKPVSADQKPVIDAESLSDQQTQQNGQGSAAKVPVSDGKPVIETPRPTVADKPAVVDVPTDQLPKTPLTDTRPPIEPKSPQILPAQEKVLQSADNKTATDKPDAAGNINNGKTPAFELPKGGATPVVSTYTSTTSQKPAQSQAQQAQPDVNSIANNPSNSNMDTGEQILVGDNITPAAAEPAPPAGAFAKIVSNIDNGPNVTGQIQDSIQSSIQLGRQQIVIRLDPPELGKVVIKFIEQGDQITGVLHVDKPETRDQIQQALPEIIQNLTESGVQVKKIEVVLSNQHEQSTAKDQSSDSGHNAWANKQNSPNPDSQRNGNTYEQWQTDISTTTGFIEPQMQFIDESINMLV